jgi:hypothetical protein
MNNNKNKSRRPLRSSRGSRSSQVASMPLLRQIRDSLVVSQTSGLPDVHDITIPPVSRDKIYTFQQSFVAAVTASTSVETDGSFNFKLSDLPNVTSFGTLFDRYRIIFVRSQWQPSSVNQTGSPVYTVIDYDDSTNITANSSLGYDTCKSSPPGAFFERSIRLRFGVEINVGGSASNGGNADPSSMWMDVAIPGVNYFGLKFAIPASASVNTWSVRFTYTVQCKNVR